MSGPRLSIIPARAATDRALKPRDLQVLCVLGRHTDDLGWCRKSQVKMADEMGCARSTVFEAIERLVKAGYLERHVQETESGRDSAHFYRVILDPKHPAPETARDPDREAGEGQIPTTPPAGISAPPAGPEPAPPAGPGPAPINDSSLTTQSERERERGREPEADASRDARAEAKAFEKAFRAWPTSISDSRSSAFRAWLALPAADRIVASQEIERYATAAKAVGRTKLCSFAVYLGERRWEGLAPRPAPAAGSAASGDVVAPAFGPVWAGLRQKALLGAMAEITEEPESRDEARRTFADMAEMLGRERAMGHFEARGFAFDAAGALLFPDDFERRAWLRLTAKRGWPTVNRMHAGASLGRGILTSRRWEALASAMEPVPVGSACMEAWRAEHERRGWPWLPDAGSMPVVYFPAGGPEALAEFEQAVRNIEERREDRDGGRPEATE